MTPNNAGAGCLLIPAVVALFAFLGSVILRFGDDAVKYGSLGYEAASYLSDDNSGDRNGTDMASSIFADDGYTWVGKDSTSMPQRVKKENLTRYLSSFGSNRESVRVMLLKDGTKYTFDGNETQEKFDSLLEQCSMLLFEPKEEQKMY